MSPLRTCGAACVVVVAWPLAAHAADDDLVVAQASPPASAAQQSSSTSARTLDKVQIIGARQQLDEARNGLSPDTGSTVYRFSKEDLANLPLGDSTPLNQVILQSPGVVQDSFGQLHVRGDHANVQYRINGVIIPEAISGFGQALETRFADSISLITGALPAQYGYRTAAVVDIRARDPGLENGGRAAVTVGSYGHVEPSLELTAPPAPSATT